MDLGFLSIILNGPLHKGASLCLHYSMRMYACVAVSQLGDNYSFRKGIIRFFGSKRAICVSTQFGTPGVNSVKPYALNAGVDCSSWS